MKTILYIDHSESWKFLLQEELEDEGYQIVTAGSIEEALSALNGVTPDLIILELRQKRFFRENLENLKKKYPNIPWIGFSTFYQCPNEYKEWVDHYLQKLPRISEIKKLIKGL
jgi:DNA-binding NtrC family response regulator